MQPKTMADYKVLHLAPAVEASLAADRPVVALESTVLAHGLPRPLNSTTAQRLEKIIADVGATPATIAILVGQIFVGLTETQLRVIVEGDQIKKISTRDLAVAVACGWNGATTVASTIRIAQRAGIQVFATGGIGGVHRGSLPDISADLSELARTPIVVVCSGAKIVLDLPATREWLETNSITVVGYQCEEMPAFYSRQSGLNVDVTANSSEDVAKLVRAQRALQIESALLVTVPVPAEFEVPSALVEQVLGDAISAAERQRVAGRDLTPFLLARMAEMSEGATLRANIALLENNARIAAEIAQALAAK
ncbi:MAG: pseudouridine-5'-phosphate glycosidase [Pyrinomonadaceae bacterium]